MKAYANQSFKVPMDMGHECEFTKGKVYQFMYRGDNEVILKDEQGCGIVYPIDEFNRDFKAIE